MSQNKLREQLAQSFLDALNEGDLPWHASWQTGRPHNAITGNDYRGVNSLWLSFVAAEKGYKDPRWCTFKQAKDQKWNVKKGEKASLIEFWSLYDKKTKRTIERKDAERIVNEDPDRKNDIILMSRTYSVFNGEQISGIPELVATPGPDISSVRANRDTLIANMGVKFCEDGYEAYYTPSTDTVTLPPEHLFEDSYGYMSTCLHECAHASGHPNRLNRDLSGRFGSEAYAREELRAEIASAFTVQSLGIGGHEGVQESDLRNHKAYIQSWIKAIESDSNELFAAIRDAEHISDYLIEKGEFCKELDHIKEPSARKPSLDAQISHAATKSTEQGRVATRLPSSEYTRL